jgi:hypothetical protein
MMTDQLTQAYADLLVGTYDCVDRIVLNAYYRAGHIAGGFREWWRRLHGSDQDLDDAHLMRMAGRFSRRLRGYCVQQGIPVIDCKQGVRKQEIARPYLPEDPEFTGLFLVLVARASASTWHVEQTKDGRIRNLERKYAYVNHYYFHIMDPAWGHVTIRMAGHPPFGAQIMLNGHEYVSRLAEQMGITFNKTGNCFTDIIGQSNGQQPAVTRCSTSILGPTPTVEVPDLAQLAVTVCSANIVGQLRQVCDRWLYSACLCFVLPLDEQGASGFEYSYSLYQMEYSRNLLFHNPGQLEACFQGMIDRTRSRLDIKRLRTIFGRKRRPWRPGPQKQPREEVCVQRPSYDLTIFKVHFGAMTVKLYTKERALLRAEAIVHNTKRLPYGRSLDAYAAISDHLRETLVRFLDQLVAVDQCALSDDEFDAVAEPGQLGAHRTTGIDLNKPRMRAVLEAVVALSVLPNGFAASDVANKVREILDLSSSDYLPRHASYDLRKLRGKQWLHRIGNSRRYQASTDGLQTMAALVLLRDKIIKPVLAGAGKPRRGAKPNNAHPVDSLYREIESLMRSLFLELGFAF